MKLIKFLVLSCSFYFLLLRFKFVLAIEATKTLDITASITSPPGIIEKALEPVAEAVKNVVAAIAKALAPAINGTLQVLAPAVQAINKTLDYLAGITAPIATLTKAISIPAALISALAVAGVALAPILITALTTQSVGQILFNLFRTLLDRILNFFTVIGLRKKRSSWGIVFNASTDEPVGGALVRIFEADHYKLAATYVTDEQGRYGFLLKPGRYYVTVTKFGYLFPVNRRIVTSYEDIYKGQPLEVKEGKTQSFHANIPLDPLEKAYKPKKWLSLALNYLRLLRLPLLIFGTAVSIITYANHRTTVNGLLILLYLFLWTLEYFSRKIKTWSEAFDTATLKGAEGAMVKVFSLTSNRLIYTEKVAPGGRLEVILSPGEYLVKGELIGFGFPAKEVPLKAKLRFRTIYQGEKVVIKKTSPLTVSLPFEKR